MLGSTEARATDRCLVTVSQKWLVLHGQTHGGLEYVCPLGLETEDSMSHWEWMDTGLGTWTGVWTVGDRDCSL